MAHRRSRRIHTVQLLTARPPRHGRRPGSGIPGPGRRCRHGGTSRYFGSGAESALILASRARRQQTASGRHGVDPADSGHWVPGQRPKHLDHLPRHRSESPTCPRTARDPRETERASSGAAAALRPAARQPSGNGSRSRTKAHSASLMSESYRGRRSGRSAASRTDGRDSHSQEWTNWTRRAGPRDTSTPGPLASRWIRQPRATKRPFFHAPAPADSPEPGPCSNRSCGLSMSESAQPHAPNGLGRTGPRRTQPRGSDTDPVHGPIPGGRFPARPGQMGTARGDGEAPNHHSGGAGAPHAGAVPGVPGRTITIGRTAQDAASQKADHHTIELNSPCTRSPSSSWQPLRPHRRIENG
ncbi:hypothetical protein QFZ22_001157 [Streptomyces canus]|uniref:Uncharacterized protein n=1 Tax=Streptomyces canus TaxID=58343 RepID=A0AAW8F5L3_9ACTN|nr:hypothetical protein [Streptomyces canus]